MLEDLSVCFKRILNGEKIRDILKPDEGLLRYHADEMIEDVNTESSIE